jgi:type I restriction enzyme S subunit
MTSGKTTTLGEASYINPRLTERLDDDTSIAFVPMAAVSSEEARVIASTDRPYREVKKGYTYFESGDVLVAKITPCFENGKIAQANLPHKVGFGSTEFHVVRPKSGVSEGRYLHHYLRQPHIRSTGERRMTGSGGQRRVPQDYLASLPLPLPPTEEQRRIAAILDQADALRAQRRQALAELDKLAQAVFVEMFGDADSNPHNWPLRSLGSLILIGPQNGLYKPSSDYGDGTPILRIDAFYDGVVTKLATLKRLRVTDKELDLYGLKTGDLVINRVNSLDYLGKSALIPELAEATVFESNMMRFSVNLAEIDPAYLIKFLQLGFIKRQVLSRAKNAVNQSSINQQDVKGLTVLLPPLHLQQAFANRIRAIESLKAKHRTALADSDALFSSLQHRAFTGAL